MSDRSNNSLSDHEVQIALTENQLSHLPADSRLGLAALQLHHDTPTLLAPWQITAAQRVLDDANISTEDVFRQLALASGNSENRRWMIDAFVIHYLSCRS